MEPCQPLIIEENHKIESIIHSNLSQEIPIETKGSQRIESSTTVGFDRVFQQYIQTLPFLSPPPNLSVTSVSDLVNKFERNPLPSLNSEVIRLPFPLSSHPHTATSNQNPEKQFVCKWNNCGISFSTRTGLATHCHSHLDSSLNLFSCKWEDCSETFRELKQLAKHLAQESHIGQTPFVPKESSKSRIYSQTRVPKFACSFEGCEKTFTNSSNKKKHELTHSAQRKRYYCTGIGCFKHYSTKTDLNLHLKVHSGDFPHKCTSPNCEKAFVRLSELYAHERAHDNILPHKCDLCGKFFREKARLQKHCCIVHSSSSTTTPPIPSLINYSNQSNMVLHSIINPPIPDKSD